MNKSIWANGNPNDDVSVFRSWKKKKREREKKEWINEFLEGDCSWEPPRCFRGWRLLSPTMSGWEKWVKSIRGEIPCLWPVLICANIYGTTHPYTYMYSIRACHMDSQSMESYARVCSMSTEVEIPLSLRLF